MLKTEAKVEITSAGAASAELVLLLLFGWYLLVMSMHDTAGVTAATVGVSTAAVAGG